MSRSISPRALLCFALWIAGAGLHAESPRETSTVRLIRNLQDGVVAIFSEGNGVAMAGSGSVIHESGYILTNNHVVEDRLGKVLFADGTVLPYTLFGRLTEKDLAVIKVSPEHPCTRIPSGYSHDLMAGEPVVAMGNPGGRGLVFSSGILSSTGIIMDASDALVMSRFKDTTRDRYLQFDATSNHGNSGGPLVNAEGKQIGVVAKKDPHEDNTNYAIPMDRVRTWLPDLLAPEERFQLWLGIKVNMLAAKAVVADVEKDSPAAGVGVQVGDIITAAEHQPIRDPIDWLLFLCQLREQKTLALTLQRGEKTIDVAAERAAYPQPKLESTVGKKPGLQYAVYYGDHLRKLPDFTALKPNAQGVTADLNPTPLAGERKEDYAVIFEGFLQLDQGGFQRLVLSCDDGARLFLDGRLVVEDPGPHAPQEASGPIRVQPGLHRLRIEYYNGAGDGELKLFLRPNGGAQRELTATEFFHE
ncbi:MAG: trypsin-like peptidase domain-containing protein [Chthoniobacter sp.]|nr:trypsin-like peptidase domain-containing protein [Chthoniobacter sp.]